MTAVEFFLLFEIVLLGSAALGMFLAWIIYHQHRDEPFNQFFRLFWRKLFTWHVNDVSGDPKRVVVTNAPIALEGSDEDDAGTGKVRKSGSSPKRVGSDKDVATVQVQVAGGASHDQVVGRVGDSIKVQLTVSPEGGDSNRAVIQLMADTLGVKVYQIQLVTGHYRPVKVVKVSGISQSEADSKLGGPA